MKNIHIYPSYIEHESRIEKITNSLSKSDVFDEIAIVGMWKKNLKQKESLSSKVKIYRVKNHFYFLPYSLKKILCRSMVFFFGFSLYLIFLFKMPDTKHNRLIKNSLCITFAYFLVSVSDMSLMLYKKLY